MCSAGGCAVHQLRWLRIVAALIRWWCGCSLNACRSMRAHAAIRHLLHSLLPLTRAMTFSRVACMQVIWLVVPWLLCAVFC